MALSLASLKSPSRNRPLMFTIVSEGGLGKTTLGSLFPAPVFIRTEDGSTSISDRDDIAMFDVAQSSNEVMEAIEVLLRENHPFKTAVFDSATRYNILVESEVLAMDPKSKGLNQAHGGFGNAYDLVSKRHLDLRMAMGYLMEVKKMNIVFLAHASTETIDPPDGDPYTRYSIPMHKKSLPHYTNDVDVVAYIKQRTYTMGDGDKKKATTDGTRIITCYPTPSHVSKNRLGIETDLVFEKGVNPFDSYLVKE